MDNTGYVKLYRKLLDNPIICKDSDYFAVWIYLLLKATHKSIDSIFKNERIVLMPGQLITGRKKIAQKLKIDENKVQRILKSFENQHQIEQTTSTKNRLITIVNWGQYQEEQLQFEQQMNNERTASEHKQECKNDKNIYYINLINKYKENPPKNFGERLKRIKAIKETNEYCSLDVEEQREMFNELINC